MAHWTSRGVGVVTTGEGDIAFFPRLYKPDATRRAVIMCRGAAGDHMYGPTVAECRLWAEDGFPIIHPDLGRTTGGGWGRDDALAKIDAAWTFMKNSYGCKTDKLILAGGSGGTFDGINWARAHTSSVACLAFTIPAFDLIDLHDNIAARNASYNWVPADIETKYTDLATYNSVKAAKNPAGHPTDISAIPQKYLYSGNDDVALPSIATTFISATGSNATGVNVGNYAHGLPSDGSAQAAQRAFAGAYA